MNSGQVRVVFPCIDLGADQFAQTTPRAFIGTEKKVSFGFHGVAASKMPALGQAMSHPENGSQSWQNHSAFDRRPGPFPLR